MTMANKILVIDDEISLLKILSKYLEKLGKGVDIAETGKEGINILKENADDYIGLICDYNLPDESSEEILQEVKNLNPNIKIILSTGFAVEEIKNRFKSIKIDATLQKPYSFSDFKNLISNLF